MSSRLPIDEDDVGFVFEDLYRGRSVLPPHDVPTRPTVVRWDFTKPVTLDNLVVLEHKDAEKHVEKCSKAESSSAAKEMWGDGAEAVVQRRAVEARQVRDWVM